jgi:uncharacterized phage protein gp47/JayE
MPNTIDSTGFDKVRFQDLRAEKAQEYKDTFDNQNLKTDVRSGVGQEVSLSTKAEDDLASTLQTLLSVFNPVSAQGIHQSNLALIMNKKRQDAVGSTVDIDITTNASGATVPAGFIVSDGVNDYTTDAEIVIAPSSTASTQTTCTVTGPIVSAAGTVTQIKTPLFGVLSSTNPQAVTVGRDREPDAALRNRMMASSADSSSTVIGLRSALSNVDGVTQENVIDNTTNATDALGIPAGSVFPIVEGGSDNDIAKALITGGVAGGIGYTEPSDIPAATIVSGTYTDNNVTPPQTHTAYWARPDEVRVYVECTIQKLPNYPADGDTKIIQAVVDWVANNSTLGRDLFSSDLICPIKTVDGVGQVTVLVDIVSPIVTSVVDIEVYQLASLDSADVTVA